MTGKRPTLEDIASVCGVSRRVVSAILAPVPSSQRVRYAEQTRLKVEQEAKRLDYRPNRTSRAMKSSRHGQIGILLRVVQSVQDGAMAPLLYRAQQLGLSVVYQLHPVGQEGLPKFISEDMVDGIIVFEDWEQEIIDAIDRYRIPLVMVNTFRTGRRGLVDLDEVGAVETIVEAFAKAGRRKVQALFSNYDVEHNAVRLGALKNACRKHGMRVPRHSDIIAQGLTDDSEGGVGLQLAAEVEPALAAGCDAFYIQFDHWAAPIYRVLADLGRSIPGDIAVAAHHLRNPEVFEPRVSGHVYPLDQGIVAVDLLEEMISGKRVGTKPRLVPYRFQPSGSIA